VAIETELKTSQRVEGHPTNIMIQIWGVNGKFLTAIEDRPNTPFEGYHTLAFTVPVNKTAGWETFEMGHRGNHQFHVRTFHKRYLCNENAQYVHNRKSVGGWETLTLAYIRDGWYSIKGGCNNQFMGINDKSAMTSTSSQPDEKASFRIYIHDLKMTTHFRQNGKYFSVDEKGNVSCKKALRDSTTEFSLHPLSTSEYNIKSQGKWLSGENGSVRLKDSNNSASEVFRLIYVPGGVSISCQGNPLSVRSDDNVCFNRGEIGGAETFAYEGAYPSDYADGKKTY